MWVFRVTTPGCIPDSEPFLWGTQDEAKRACIREILLSADITESECIAEELTASAEIANLEAGEFGGVLADGFYYCVEKI